MWTDVIADRIALEQDVRRAWAGVFDLEIEEVAVTPDWGETERWDLPCVRVAVARLLEPARGIPMILSIVPRDDPLEDAVTGDARTLDTVQRFRVALDCRAIPAVEAVGLFSWTLISPTERWRIRGFEPCRDVDHPASTTFEPLSVASA